MRGRRHDTGTDHPPPGPGGIVHFSRKPASRPCTGPNHPSGMALARRPADILNVSWLKAPRQLETRSSPGVCRYEQYGYRESRESDGKPKKEKSRDKLKSRMPIDADQAHASSKISSPIRTKSPL